MSEEYLAYYDQQDADTQAAIGRQMVVDAINGKPAEGGGCNCGSCPPNSYCGKVNGVCKCIGTPQ